ncbi:MAG: tRNA (guanosine(37)-N1)-methyltransferase TrmD [Candidatus Tectomicrobia bacterium]|uniref:tRNA (guanine-N(1)-)-methyltransferase n=1 Tax=Tectimicrobiota bacterium TaxID=2528274 RepID=A0A932CPE7_UNCTE|nr:tRNA (guanosine(37)-N1)-methyltransferase TrmD [Candidatus Tectomicrobia bacterium]
MEFHVVTLFPEIFDSPLQASLLKKAQEKGAFRVIVHPLREYGLGRHKIADDYSYGGGGGMVMRIEPIVEALEAILAQAGAGRVILMSPQGRPFHQEMAKTLARETCLVLICGHYEGIDERVTHYVDEEISIGDYVLTGGELPALVVIEAVARLIPGVVGCSGSVEEDSFYQPLLDYPHYTRPDEFRGLKVPEILLSGNHAAIRRWRRKEALKRTYQRRPDLLRLSTLSQEDRALLEEALDGVRD